MTDTTKKLLNWGLVLGAAYLIYKAVKDPKSLGLSGGDEQRELELYTINDGDIYRQRIQPILANLRRKIKKGTYDAAKAVKLWGYAADAGAQKYNKEFGDAKGKIDQIFKKADRMAVAKSLQEHYEEELRNP